MVMLNPKQIQPEPYLPVKGVSGRHPVSRDSPGAVILGVVALCAILALSGVALGVIGAVAWWTFRGLTGV